jgi:hypothetical protein
MTGVMINVRKPLKNKAYKNMITKKNTRRAREEYQRRRYEEKKLHR